MARQTVKDSAEEAPTEATSITPTAQQPRSSGSAAEQSQPKATSEPFRVYMTLQGKGGCGKTVATYLAVQYLRSIGKDPVVVDADPVNKTLRSFSGICAEPYALFRENEIDPRRYDELVERILTTDRDFVIDNGASSFVTLSSYLAAGGIASLLAANGRELVINTVVVGGESQDETFLALEMLAERMPTTRLICWVNEFFGPVGGDTDFEETATYKAVSSRIWGLVRLEKLPEATFGRDFRRMMTDHLTFDEAIKDAKYMIMEKQRLTMIQRNTFAEISKAQM